MRKFLMALAVFGLLAAACGDDDDSESSSGSVAAYCELATELDAAEEQPTAEQLAEISSLAPEEIKDDVETLVAAIPTGDFENPEVGAASDRLTTWEAENCDGAGAGDEGDDGEGDGEDENAAGGAVGSEYCAVSKAVDEQDGPPNPEQLAELKALAPPAIADDVTLAANRLLAAPEGDLVAFIAVIADDEVEEAIERIEAHDADACGIEQDDEGLPAGSTQELEDDATRVDVVATDFAFDVPEVRTGRTSFVLTNDGNEAHFLGLGKLLGDATIEQALEADDPEAEGLIESLGDTELAAPGGEDEEFLTVDLEPGRYAMVCFIPTADGTPHAFVGMAQEFTVS